MTLDDLLNEGRKLTRPCVLLKADGSGEPAARWYDYDRREVDETKHRCWLTVDCRHLPDRPSQLDGYLTLFTNEQECEGGYVALTDSWPDRRGTELFARPAAILPPIDAIIALGSATVDRWLAQNKWQRERRYNDNFKDRELVHEYERAWFNDYPVYRDDGTYAALGGWHWPCADDDWHDLIDEHLLIFTVFDSEPWVEAWRLHDGSFRVIQRIT
jgi:hypothetical protein